MAFGVFRTSVLISLNVLFFQTVQLVGNIIEDHVITLMGAEEVFMGLMYNAHYGNLEQYLPFLIQCGTTTSYKLCLIQVS